MARYATLLLAFAGLVAVFWVGLTKDPSELPSTLIGKPAPAFSLPSLQDTDVTIGSDNLKGQVVLFNVWATWCVGCRQEHEFLMQLASQGNVPIYGLNWRDNRDAALDWLRQLGDPYVATAFDEDARVGIDWGVYAAPETFLLDAEGVIIHKHLGPLDMTIWQRDFMPKISAARTGGE